MKRAIIFAAALMAGVTMAGTPVPHKTGWKTFYHCAKGGGVSYRGAGENIAWGQKTPEQVMNGWMNSAGHRANILNEKFTSIGVGYHQNANGVNYWSQLFTY